MSQNFAQNFKFSKGAKKKKKKENLQWKQGFFQLWLSTAVAEGIPLWQLCNSIATQWRHRFRSIMYMVNGNFWYGHSVAISSMIFLRCPFIIIINSLRNEEEKKKMK